MPSPKKIPNPPPPAPPPPPPSSFIQNAPNAAAPKPPSVASKQPPGAFLVELLIYNGSPFKDHWAYWVRSHIDPDVGVLIHATGDVRNGFTFEVKRNHDFRATGNVPSKRVPLQWVDRRYFDESAMLNNGKRKIDYNPVCGFESSAYKITPPGKTLNDKVNTTTNFPTINDLVTIRNFR
ncbi:Fc.00g081650.m01.CDS01 [Cosmosporella sp. VM-42]